ncbi:MAG: SRPBCC family protein [Gallionellaceae bacterium]|nr:SRPBCC family protein [Gallionellaceae bacterium]
MTQVALSRPTGARAALLAALLAAAPACLAGELRVQSLVSDTEVVVEGRMEAAVGRAVAWQVLTDHDRFPAFVPGVQISRVVEARGNDKIVVQRGEVTAGARLRFDGIARVVEQPGEGMRVRFLAGPFRDSDGEWRLSGDRPVSLSYRLRIDLTKTPLPPPMAGAAAEQQVRVWLSALTGEMERRQGKR